MAVTITQSHLKTLRVVFSARYPLPRVLSDTKRAIGAFKDPKLASLTIYAGNGLTEDLV